MGNPLEAEDHVGDRVFGEAIAEVLTGPWLIQRVATLRRAG